MGQTDTDSQKETVRRGFVRRKQLTLEKVLTMAMIDPGQRLPEEQEYVLAYENVREKCKGN